MKMLDDRRVSMKEAALQQLEGIDPKLLGPLIPHIREVFRRGRGSLYDPKGFAMNMLARVGDRDSAGMFRRYAAGHDSGSFDYRMPLVLATYLEDPQSVVRRIADHDHEWMPLLAQSAAMLDKAGMEQVLVEGSKGLPDIECRRLCEESLARLLRERQGERPSWDLETSAV
jgi:hypothetical protein